MPAVGRICETVAPSLIVSMRSAVTKGIVISQATSPSTRSGVAMVYLLYSRAEWERRRMMAP